MALGLRDPWFGVWGMAPVFISCETCLVSHAEVVLLHFVFSVHSGFACHYSCRVQLHTMRC